MYKSRLASLVSRVHGSESRQSARNMLLVLLLSGLSGDLNRHWSVPFSLLKAEIHPIRQIMRTLADEQGQLMRRLLITGGKSWSIAGIGLRTPIGGMCTTTVSIINGMFSSCDCFQCRYLRMVALLRTLYTVPLIFCTVESPLLLTFDSTKVQVA